MLKCCVEALGALLLYTKERLAAAVWTWRASSKAAACEA